MDRNAQVLYGGGFDKLCPFYLGLYGGSQLPGILNTDHEALGFFQASGYQVLHTKQQTQIQTAHVTPPVSRELRLLKRQYVVKAANLYGATTWWEASTLGEFDRVVFELAATTGGPAQARCQMWRLEPYSVPWGDSAAGLNSIFVRRPERRRRLATFLLGEAMRLMRNEGFSLILAQFDQQDLATQALADRLGFETWGSSSVLVKHVPGAAAPEPPAQA